MPSHRVADSQGPAEKLNNTVYSQPALFVAGLAAVEKLREEDSSVVERCSATAGLSLGEYTALVFAGVLSFDDALKVVKVRPDHYHPFSASPHAEQMVIPVHESATKR